MSYPKELRYNRWDSLETKLSKSFGGWRGKYSRKTV